MKDCGGENVNSKKGDNSKKIDKGIKVSRNDDIYAVVAITGWFLLMICLVYKVVTV